MILNRKSLFLAVAYIVGAFAVVIDLPAKLFAGTSLSGTSPAESAGKNSISNCIASCI